MYVCVCKGITEKQVKDVLSHKRNQNIKDVLNALGVGTDCGTCIEGFVRDLQSSMETTPFELKDQCLPIKK